MFRSLSLFKTSQILYRRSFNSPAYALAKKVMPRISDTEAAALNSGTVGFDRDIFGGSPSLEKLVSKYDAFLTSEEREYYHNECETLCEMIDDYQIALDQNLPPEVWKYVRDNGFLGLCVSKEYGGRGFSAHAHSVMLQKVATRSIAAGVTVMVPNSLGTTFEREHQSSLASRTTQ